jgi:hypothetical protein
MSLSKQLTLFIGLMALGTTSPGLPVRAFRSLR